MRVLVTGGAGYVGSHVVRALQEAGHLPVVYDDLSLGHAAAVAGLPLEPGDVGDAPRLAEVMRRRAIEAVVHCAARTQVGESVARPDLYYRVNVAGSQALLDAMRDAGVRRLVFSSSAAVYGTPEVVPIPEDHPQRPLSPYGETKAAVERMIGWYAGAFGLRAISLRYFNAAGAHPSGELGEDHDPETHLIPIVLQAALGLRSEVTVLGEDYPTPDGTAIRDYVHVWDLARAHVRALELLAEGHPGGAFNLGTGRGHSVRAVIDAARRVTGRPIPSRAGPRRAGDPPVLVADPGRALRELGWRPVRSDLETIVRDAWRWHAAHPRGYGDA